MQYISPVWPPPIPAPQQRLGAGELCMRDHSHLDELAAGELCMRDHSSLGAFDPLSATVGAASSIFQTLATKKIADKQAKLEAAKLKAEREQNAREFALMQAQMLALPHEKKRLTQTYVLVGIAGAAALISGIFLLAAIRAKKD